MKQPMHTQAYRLGEGENFGTIRKVAGVHIKGARGHTPSPPPFLGNCVTCVERKREREFLREGGGVGGGRGSIG